MFTKHDYVIADPYTQPTIGQKMTQHVTGEIPCTLEIPRSGNNRRTINRSPAKELSTLPTIGYYFAT